MDGVHWPGSHVVITGGSSGIGAEVAELAADRGARLTLVARDRHRLDDTVGRLQSRRPTADVVGVSCDVSDRAAVTQALAEAVADRGPVEALVCSAGISRPGRFLELPEETFGSMMDVDYFGTVWPIRAVAPSMVQRRRGSIVGISSASGLVGIYGFSAYAAAKFAVRGLLESLRTEMVPHGVHVGCVFPGDVDTPMLAAEAEFKPAETAAIAGSLKVVPPRQVAQAVITGIDRRQAEIFADATTRSMARTVALTPSIYRRAFDRQVRTAGRKATEPTE